MDVRRFAFCLIAASIPVSNIAQGAAPEPEAASEAERGIRLQPGDDVAEPIDPIREPTPEDEQRLDAMGWFGLAKLRESRGDFRGALEAYREAAERDPERLAIYRGLVPLAFSLNEGEIGLQYALKLVDLDPGDSGLMQQLSRVLVTRGQVAEATALLERAASVATLDKKSAQYVSLQRDLGVLYAAQGEAEKASIAFEVLLSALKKPEAYGLDTRARAALLADPSTTYDRLGQTFLDAGKTDLAVEAFEKAAESRRNRPGVLQYDLARVYLKAGKPEQALEQLEKYVGDERTDRGRAAYDLLGDVLTALGREKEFEDRLRTIAEKDSDNPHVKLVLAERYAVAEKLDDAAALYESALDEVPDPAGHLGLADVYRRQKKTGELVERLARAAVAGAPDDALSASLKKVAEDEELTDGIMKKGRSDASADPPKLDFATAFLFGKLAAEAERVEDASAFYNLAARIRPDRAADIYDELGLTLLLAEKYDDAVATYRKAIESPADDGTRLNLLFRLSQALEFAGKTDEALAAVDEALKVAPEAALLHYQRGWVHFHARRWDEAIGLFQQVIERFPQDADTVRQARLSLSALYVERGDKAKGQQVLEDVYAVSPDDPSVNNDLGYLYADEGKNLEQAEGMIRKALAAEPENAAYLDSMGWVLHRLGRDEEAVVHLEKAVSLPEGDDATLWEHLGDVYDKLGKRDKAREAWTQALERAKKEAAPKPEEIKAIEAKLNP